MEIILIGVGWSILWGIVGSVIGAKKGRPILGFLCSLLCGPLGVLAVIIDKGNRRECSFCMERIHKDASICPYCRREVHRNAYFEDQEAAARWRVGTMALIVITLLVVAAVASLVLLRNTKSNAVTRSSNNTKTVSTSKSQAESRITIGQFQKLRKNMLYKDVIEILGGSGERTSEIKLNDYSSLVTYHWINRDGSMVIVDFKKLAEDENWGLLAHSISSVGLKD